MFALFLTAVFALAATAALVVVADGGLRWLSAFGQLRQRLKLPVEAQAGKIGMRPAIVHGGFTRPCHARCATRQQVQRAA